MARMVSVADGCGALLSDKTLNAASMITPFLKSGSRVSSAVTAHEGALFSVGNNNPVQ
jgi:hypothetical protein